MKKMASKMIIFLIGLLLLGLSPQAGKAASMDHDALELYPALDQTWVTQPQIYLVGIFKDHRIKEISIKGVKVSYGEKNVVPVKNGAFGVVITLKKGLNQIDLKASGIHKKVKIFYSESGQGVPQGFRRLFVHSLPARLECAECHPMRKGRLDYSLTVPVPSNCTTGSCHPEIKANPHLHGPVRQNECIQCHNPHGSFNPYQLVARGKDLCFTCHEGTREDFEQRVVHPPGKDDCMNCHDPHGSQMEFHLKGEGSISSVCFQCHEKRLFSKRYPHGPVADGECIACHNHHGSPYDHLLSAPLKGGKICLTCHEDRKEEFSMAYVHKPVAESCANCHDPHSSDYRYQLLEPSGKLCISCHKKLDPEVITTIEGAKYRHPSVEAGRCVDCHQPHTSNYEALLKDFEGDLCFSCHKDLAAKVRKAQFLHGPVQEGTCDACHNPHGSAFSRLLVRSFPAGFLNDYSPGKYDLCYSCHNKEVIETKFTTVLTNFRDVDYNLHYAHVRRKSGNSCKACHAIHASNQPKHMREKTEYRGLRTELKFVPTGTGGSCLVGCHKEKKEYDREHPHFKHPSK
ncbi:cytochrome c3 family protein [Thermosulfuriphilus sp.]